MKRVIGVNENYIMRQRARRISFQAEREESNDTIAFMTFLIN